MQSSLKKSLYVGLAALSFGAIVTLSTTANAKSYATAGAYTTLKTDPTTRNVAATGANALYTKPGTVKGAKVVASKATMAKLAASKSSASYFRAYGVKTTNRGSVYYRVVTMDGKYRGYVYGGKSTSAFAGGIKSVNTTTPANLPSQVNNYYLKDTTKNTIWTAPKNTQYQASKVSLYGAAKSDTFTIDKAVTKTLEGSLYYHVTDTNNTAVTGWIYAGGLTTEKPAATATADNSVAIKYVDSNFNSIGSATYITTTAGTKEKDVLSATDLTALNEYATAQVPTGYMVSSAAVTAANYGSTIQVQVTQAAFSKVSFMVSGDSTTSPKPLTATDINGGAFPSLTAVQQQATFFGKTSNKIDITTADVFKTGGKLNTLTGATQTDANGNHFYYTYTFDAAATQAANTNATYGQLVKAYYTTTTNQGSAPSTTVDNGNTNYVD